MMSELTRYFPSFSEGLSLRVTPVIHPVIYLRFPFLFGGAFIEGQRHRGEVAVREFPFLFGGAFIEGLNVFPLSWDTKLFPFLFGGAFIEGH